ncbi:hypothetical protein LIA77_04595 [Sarocladium implicatum]|nr:hypothetical protein LIA77_04595 [Sarocladium implicatum]
MPSTKGPIFRMFSPSAKSKEENVEKRREQVRRAQHVYRQRKTRYVKSLEADLAASRTRERDMSRRNGKLEAQVKALLQLLEIHGLDVPDLEALPVDDHSVYLGITQFGTAQYAHAEWPKVQDRGSPLPSLESSPQSDPVLSSPVCQFDQTMIGMEFVLKIEEPCLGHVHGDPTRPEDPSNHALTVTSQLLCITSSLPPKRSSLVPVQDVPSDILDRLLALAPAVSGEDEITPIQAWDSLRRKPVTGSLDIRTVMTLAEKLRDSAKCHGFGAVLTLGAFDHIVGELMRSTIGSQLSGNAFGIPQAI